MHFLDVSNFRVLMLTVASFGVSLVGSLNLGFDLLQKGKKKLVSVIRLTKDNRDENGIIEGTSSYR